MDSNKDFDTYSVNLADLEDTLTVRGSTSGYDSTDTIVLGSGNSGLGGISLTSPYTFTGSIGSGSLNSVYTTSGTGTNTPWFTQNPSARISLSGEDADIEVNGWSLVDAIKSIEQRLAIMRPDPKLESEWEELKQLGDQYRKLEQHIRDKQATWDKLKAMPPPAID